MYTILLKNNVILIKIKRTKFKQITSLKQQKEEKGINNEI